MTATETQQAIEYVEDGIYEDVPDDLYHIGDEWSNRLSKSKLDYGMVSMKHLKAAVDGKLSKSSTGFSFGRACHMRLLEPERFASTYIVEPDFGNMRTKQAKEDRDAFYAAHEGKQFVSQADAETLDAINASVRHHKAVNLLRAAGGCEVAIAWHDQQTGIAMKSRLDKHIADFKGLPVILDLKTCDPYTFQSPHLLERAVYRYGYHRQAAIYTSGLKTITGANEPAEFVFVFIEKDYPFDIRVERLSEAALKQGATEYRSILQAWKWATDHDVYPGVSEDLGEISIPRWELNEGSDEDE